MSNELDLFDDDGDLDIPTMRGSANLDVQDYQRPNGIDSSILDDELQEDTPSTPGRNPGAAAATDVEGTSDFDLLGGGQDDLSMDDEGMEQSDYGSYPWGPGAGGGYRPHAMQRTDMSLRALGEDDEHQPQSQAVERDEMYNEPEVVQAMEMEQQTPWPEEYHGNRNQMPSNRGVDPRTLYDRDSYEHNKSTQATIGSGIFGMEEGVTWRPRDGIFANQYALPAYIAEEDEVGVQQSDMWDTTADEWRVTQVSQGGVPMSRDAQGKAPWNGAKNSAYSPFRQQSQGVSGAADENRSMRPESTGPRSHVEAFGRGVSACIMREAMRRQQGPAREKFMRNALDALGPNRAARCKQVADHLVRMGYRPDVAMTDAIAHCVMHATVEDLQDKRRKRPSDLPRLDLLSKRLGAKATKEMAASANRHLAPLINDKGAMRKDLGALFGSPAARGMGQFGAEPNNQASNSERSTEKKKGLLRPRNLVIAGLLGVGGYLVYRNRDDIADSWRRMMGQE